MVRASGLLDMGRVGVGRTVLPRAALQAALYKTVRMVGGTVSTHDQSLFKHGHPSLTQEA